MTPKKWWHFLILLFMVGGLVVASLTALAISLIYPTLPSLETITDYRPKQPLRVYSADKYLIREFGEERRAFIKIKQVPQNLKDAVLAIEDRRFYQHRGIDIRGVLRAVKNNLTNKSREGASTITMQVAKNFFTGPNRKRDLVTKIKEALLAIKIEKTINKGQILELYLNQIYLGQRAYGFSAASQVYYGKPLSELSLAESALLAGLPKAPSGYNPFTRPKKAIARQHEVLRDMRRYNFISEDQFNQAMAQELEFKSAERKKALGLDAGYVAELVRQILYKRYGDDIYKSGLKVYTTIYKEKQEAANKAVIKGIIDYQRRRGFKRAEGFIDLSTLDSSNIRDEMIAALSGMNEYSGFIPAIVTKTSAKSVNVFTKNGGEYKISGKGLRLLRRNLAQKNKKHHKIKAGSIIRIIKVDDEWHIIEFPQVQSALIALDPNDGAITALVGGFNFSKNKFNHATQAKRQAGSSFKPFVYSAALEKGFTPASIIEDEPITMTAGELGSRKEWSPKNYDGQYDGPIRIREALKRSKNMVSIRVLDKIGSRYAQSYATKFGFYKKDHPAYLTMALGAGEVTPIGLANGYAVFANGGYRVEPHIIAKITNSEGKVLEEKKYPRARKNAPRVIDGRNAFLMTSMMQDVVQSGTATKAKRLGRKDIAGKTGTTNDLKDAWFAGYSPHEVAVSWMGYDQPRSLGRVETGGKAALPIWVSYMAVALKGKVDKAYRVPTGVMSVKIDPIMGTLAYDDEEGIYEYFYHENPPPFLEPDWPPMLDPFGYPEDSNQTNPLQPMPPKSQGDANKTSPIGQDPRPIKSGEPIKREALPPLDTPKKKINTGNSPSNTKPKPTPKSPTKNKDSMERAANILNPGGH